jgi:hypothetical protein
MSLDAPQNGHPRLHRRFGLLQATALNMKLVFKLLLNDVIWAQGGDVLLRLANALNLGRPFERRYPTHPGRGLKVERPLAGSSQ